MTQPQVLQGDRLMVALEASTLAAERREDARTANPAVSTLSRHVDAIEAHVDDVLTFFSLAEANPQALSNLLARLQRVQQTIETAARK